MADSENAQPRTRATLTLKTATAPQAIISRALQVIAKEGEAPKPSRSTLPAGQKKPTCLQGSCDKRSVSKSVRRKFRLWG